jgi:cytochrome b561
MKTMTGSEYTPAPGPPAAPRNGLGTAGLVLGILAVAIPFLGWFLLSIIGLGLSIGGWVNLRRGVADNRGVTLWGFWLNVAGFLLPAVLVAIAQAGQHHG